MDIEGMKFKRAGGTMYMKPTELPTNGKFLVGKYRESFEGEFGINHKFSQRDAGCVIINGCGSLNKALENVEPGTWVALTFDGKKVLEKGKFKGKQFNDVKVYICDEPSDEAVNAADDIPF